MKDNILSFTPDIDKQIIQAVEAVLNTKVLKSSRITQGEYNYVYKLETDQGFMVAKVFRNNNWPEKGKLPWIEKQFKINHVRHAKLLYYSRESNYFANGFCVSEYIDGINGADAIHDGKISFLEFHIQLAELLDKIHKIKLEEFGFLNNGKGEYDSLLEYTLEEVKLAFEQLNQIHDLNSSDLHSSMNDAVTKLLGSFDKRFTPVLIHCDPTPDNTIYTPQGKVILVDWDNAMSGSWINDLAWLTYWGSVANSNLSFDERVSIIRQAFDKYHNHQDFTDQEVLAIEKAMHIRQSASLLPYYYFLQKDMQAYQMTLKKLASLLNG